MYMESQNNNQPKWEVTANRFVAFLDILGFKDHVMRNSHQDVYATLEQLHKYKSAIKKKLIKNPKNNEDIHIVNFSDSIIIFSNNDSKSNFEYFLVTIAFITAKALGDKIPIKGGMAHGNISVDINKQIYFGQPIIDAYFMEEELNYMGIVAHNSIDKYIHQNPELLDFANEQIPEIDTPLKSGKWKHRNLNLYDAESAIKQNKENAIHDNVVLFKTSTSGAARKYIDNTIKVLDELKKISSKDPNTNSPTLKAL